MKNAKRILALLAALVLVFAGLNCFAEEGNYLEPKSLNAAGKSVNQWVATDASREDFVVKMITDSILMWTDHDSEVFAYACASEAMYMAVSDNIISVFAFGENHYFNFLYIPEGGLALYGVEPLTGASKIAASSMRNMKNDGVVSNYWQIDCASVFATLDNMTNG